MSQSGSFTTAGSIGAVTDLQGNTGGPVGPNGSGIINVVGTGSISVAGNPGTNTLTISSSGGGGSGITTINGDTGSITGSIVTIFANNAGLNCGSSVSFVNSVTTSTLNVSDGNQNTIIGGLAGNSSISGTSNCAYGMQSATSLTSGSSNNFFGTIAGASCTSGISNNCFGSASGGSVSSGSFNLLLGDSSANSLLTGSYNTILGPTISGSAYTTSESSNILVANAGVNGESHVMRLGTAGSGNGQVNTCYVAGINGNTIVSPAFVTIDTSTGQLGTAGSAGAGIITLDGDSGAATGSTVTILAGNSTLVCGSTVKFVNSGSAALVLEVTDANDNVIIGLDAGNSSITAASCVGLGRFVFQDLTTGTYSTAIGWGAGDALTSGQYNTFVGALCGGRGISTGQHNTGIGSWAISTVGFNGSDNIAVGYFAGTNYATSESSNIVIGNLGTASESNVIRIGTQGSSAGQQNTCFIAGIHGVTITGAAVLINSSGQLGDIVSSIKVKENIKDISSSKNSILDCRPVSFTYKSDPEKNTCYGMIAEEVEKVFPDLVIYKDGSPYSIKYHEMPALLLAEIQKLKVEISELKSAVKNA